MRKILSRWTGGALALLLAAVVTQAAAAPATFSNSGNLSMSVLASTGSVEIVPEGSDGFRLQGVGGGPLVAAGSDLTVDLFVQALNGTTISNWLAQLFGAPGASIGEIISDGGQTTGLGNATIAAGGSAVLSFATQTSLVITKDINGLNGQVDYVIQGLPVPEPASLLLLGLGIAGLAAARRGARPPT